MNPAENSIARIRIHMWLGLKFETRKIFKNLDDGYGLSEIFVNQLLLPSKMFYSEKHEFELRAHIYQGRNLLGLDSSGLSDPYINIVIGNQSVKSKRKVQTNNPKWGTTFIIPHIYLYGNLEYILNNPPEIIIEVFDEDFGKVSNSFCIKNIEWAITI